MPRAPPRPPRGADRAGPAACVPAFSWCLPRRRRGSGPRARTSCRIAPATYLGHAPRWAMGKRHPVTTGLEGRICCATFSTDSCLAPRSGLPPSDDRSEHAKSGGGPPSPSRSQDRSVPRPSPAGPDVPRRARGRHRGSGVRRGAGARAGSPAAPLVSDERLSVFRGGSRSSTTPRPTALGCKRSASPTSCSECRPFTSTERVAASRCAARGV